MKNKSRFDMNDVCDVFVGKSVMCVGCSLQGLADDEGI